VKKAVIVRGVPILVEEVLVVRQIFDNFCCTSLPISSGSFAVVVVFVFT